MSLPKMIVASALLLLPGTVSHAQSVSDPALLNVLEACQTASATADCQSATQSYLTTLQQANLPAGEYDQRVADLVVALATQAQQDEVCDERDELIAATIRVSSGYSGSAAQRAQIEQIAETIRRCDELATAALEASLSDGGGEGGGSGPGQSGSSN